MRFEGTLTQWNDDRGFGFIQPTDGGQTLFAHISAFPRDGQRPQLHERLSFEVTLGPNGKKQAAAIQRPRSVAPLSRAARPAAAQMPRNRAGAGVWGKLVALLLAGALLAVGYWKYDARQSARASAAAPASAQEAPLTLRAAPVSAPVVTQSYRCDGRQHCSQMSSCAEATFFLKNCPNTKMDGDSDGVPCEEQWCR